MGRSGGSGGRSSGGRSGGFGSSHRSGSSGGFGSFGSSSGGGFFGSGSGMRPGGAPGGGGNYGGRGGPSGCGCGMYIIVLVIILIYLVLNGAFGSTIFTGSSEITKSSVDRQSLPAGSVNETEYYTDELGWINNQTKMEDGLKYFYRKTGVQP